MPQLDSFSYFPFILFSVVLISVFLIFVYSFFNKPLPINFLVSSKKRDINLDNIKNIVKSIINKC